MNRPAYSLIALDIDGTLLDPHGLIRPRVRAAVRRAVQAGCIVTLATGRRHQPAREIADDLGLDTPLILYSGSIVYDTRTETALLHRPLPPAFIRAAIRMLREAGLSPGVLQSPLRGERIFLGPSEMDDDFTRDYAGHPHRLHLVERLSFEELEQVEDPLVVIAFGAGLELYEVLYRARSDHGLECHLYGYGLRHSRLQNVHGFDVLPAGHNKAHALEWLAGHYGLGLDQVMVVGDNFNDIEMLQVAGLGVAMGNATPEAQAAAGRVVASNAEDGVAEAIERFVLGC